MEKLNALEKNVEKWDKPCISRCFFSTGHGGKRRTVSTPVGEERVIHIFSMWIPREMGKNGWGITVMAPLCKGSWHGAAVTEGLPV